MKSMAEILKATGGAAAQARAAASVQRSVEEEKPRPYKVHLAVTHFLEIELGAVTPAAAESQALQLAAEAKLRFIGGPCPFRTEVLVRADPSNPESSLVWVTVEKPGEERR